MPTMKHVFRMATCLILAISVLPLNSAFAGEYDDDFATVNTWLNDINGKAALVYAEITNVLMQLNQRTISNTYTLRYYIEETYNDQHKILLQLTTDTQNSTTTIRGYLGNISSKISSIKTSIDSVQSDISSILTKQASIATNTGDIYARLGAMKTSDENFYTMMQNWDLSWVSYKNQLLDWGTAWNTTFGTISTNISAINNNLITGFTSIEGKLDTLHTDLQTIIGWFDKLTYYTTHENGTSKIWYLKVLPISPNDASHIQNWVQNVRQYLLDLKNKVNTITIPDYSTTLSIISGYVDGLEGSLSTLQTTLTSISGYVDGLEGSLTTLHTDLQSILTWFDRLTYYTTHENGTSQIWFFKVVPLSPNDNSHINYWVQNVRQYLLDLKTTVNAITIPDYSTTLSSISGYVDGLESSLSAIIGLLSVPSNTTTIVGDLDSLQFEDDVDDLVDELSNLAPFGAVFLLSSEIGLIVTANTIQTPQFVMPFNFFGQNNVTIDLSWLITAKPFLNFLMMFLLVYSLAVVSMKYARNEATS